MTLHVEADRRRNRGAQKLHGLVHDGIGVDVRFAGRLMPAEGEDLLDEMFRAVAGEDDRSAIGGTTFADKNPSAVGELTLQIVVAQAVLVETRLTPLVRRLARSGFTSYFRHDDELITGTEDCALL